MLAIMSLKKFLLAFITVKLLVCAFAVPTTTRYYFQLVSGDDSSKVCQSVDVRTDGRSKAYQIVGFNSTSAPREPHITTGELTIKGRSIVRDKKTRLYVEYGRPDMLAILGRDRKKLGYVVTTKPEAPKDLYVARRILRRNGLRPKKILQENCKYVPETVSAVDIDAYTGAWLQVVGNRESIFSGVTRCISAFYRKINDTAVSVLNGALAGDLLVSIRGVASIPNVAFPGQLVVRFGSVAQEGNYWIVAVGPIRKGKYDWAVVTNPELESLFVLARNEVRYKKKYKRMVEKMVVTKFGFAKKKFVRIEQGKDCTYVRPVQKALPQ